MSIIHVDNLTKSFISKKGPIFRRKKELVKAVDGISLSIVRGQIFSLLGPIGAGKTTTIKVLATLLIPTSGSACVKGFDVVKDDHEVRKIMLNQGDLWRDTKSYLLLVTGYWFTMRKTGWKIHLGLMGAIIWKNILEYRRYPLEIVFTFLMPIVWFLPTYFLIISFAPNGASSGLASWIGTDNFFSFYMIGMIVGYFTATIFWSMGFSLKRLMDIGMLETIWVCPISKLTYIIGESLFSLIRLTYEMTILIITYKLVFRMAMPPAIWQAIPYFIPFIFMMYGFGIAFASLVLLIKDANTMIDTSSFLVQTLSGVQNPPQVFPRFFLAISLAIPITYFLDIVRVHTLGIGPLIPYGLELFIFLTASLIFPIGGVWFFKYIERKCRIEGSLHVH